MKTVQPTRIEKGAGREKNAWFPKFWPLNSNWLMSALMDVVCFYFANRNYLVFRNKILWPLGGFWLSLRHFIIVACGHSERSWLFKSGIWYLDTNEHLWKLAANWSRFFCWSLSSGCNLQSVEVDTVYSVCIAHI